LNTVDIKVRQNVYDFMQNKLISMALLHGKLFGDSLDLLVSAKQQLHI